MLKRKVISEIIIIQVKQTTLKTFHIYGHILNWWISK